MIAVGVHDRNLGFSLGMQSLFEVPAVYVSEEFTKKLFSLNRGVWHGVAAVKRSGPTSEQEILKINPQVLYMAPFCAPFSNLNRTRNPLDDDPMKHPKLKDMLESVRLALDVLPDYVAIETVERGRDFMENIIAPRFAEKGYYVTIFAHNAYKYGVPQSRNRVIMLCSWKGQFPPPYFFKTQIEEPFSAMDYLNTLGEIDYLPAPKPEILELLDYTPQGQKLRRVFKYMVGDESVAAPGLGFYRLHELGPAPVISQSTVLFHPHENRYLTVKEVLTLLTFPAHLEIPNKWINVYRLGNGVMPDISYLIARLIYQVEKEFISRTSEPRIQIINTTTKRGGFMNNDKIPENLFGSHPEWRGRFRIRGWENDRSQR